MKSVIFFALLFLLFPGALLAESIDISTNLRLHFEVPNGWVVAAEPPQFLVDEMAEHIEHDAAKKGRKPTQEQLQRAARKRFEENESLLYNQATHSFLTLDFSRLGQGERAPSHKSIKLSTRYAGESLSNEEGVTDFSTDDSNIDIKGAWYSHRFDSHYKHHDKPMAFIGIVGFASPYWFYFYYTDYLAEESDRMNAEKILKSIRIEDR